MKVHQADRHGFEVGALDERGIDPWLVTGDSSQVAVSVAREVGIDIDHVVSGALPQDKVDKVKALQEKGHRVLMIGDGVNDALNLSSKTLRIIRGNLAWAFLYNVIGIPVAAFGALRPMYAAGAMEFSSVLVVTNSLRIK